MNTVASSQLHDSRIVPYFEITLRGMGPWKAIRVPFNVHQWKREQENITANRGLPYEDTTTPTTFFNHYF